MEERCVCCGEIIPEGRMVCMQCEGIYKNNTANVGEVKIKRNENVLINHVETCGQNKWKQGIKRGRINLLSEFCQKPK